MKWFRKSWPYIALVVLVAVNVAAWSSRESIGDWWRLRDYQAPEDIAMLTTDDSMTDYARRLFYVNHPSLESKDAFNIHCADESRETAVLGCYHGNRQGIYIYAVTDTRLAGVRQVTAAHEMLHQAYDRLGSKERQRVDTLLENYYQAHLHDETIKAKLDSYKSQKDVVLVNEMHSIFGSEVRDLPTELETYYSRYFTDRHKVVAYGEAYRAEFTRRQKLVEQYDAQLTDLKKKINKNRSDLETKLTFLQTKEKEIQKDIADRDQTKYEADVQVYNSTVQAYNGELATTRGLIEEHNRIVGLRNEIAVQEQQLQQALDSRMESPAPKQ